MNPSKLSLDKNKIRVLLLENIHPKAVKFFHENGYENVEHASKALSETKLKEKISQTHIIGIRSRTQLTKDVLDHAHKLMAIGCFSVGTNQVDLVHASHKSIPVFNAPYSNTRSVAELVIAQAIMLLRGIPLKSYSAHQGQWLKSAQDSFEAREKTLGIVGYGHIGTQVSILAEAMGMNVIYYDIMNKLALGNAKPVDSLKELLQSSDVITFHVPQTPQTQNMITEKELGYVKNKAHIINASRGNVIDIEALSKALDGHIAGAAIDVFPKEPKGTDDTFVSPLRGKNQVILTPHIGGSTQEAQENIGREVAEKLVKYSDNGSTMGAVNFPEVSLPIQNTANQRILHIHQNNPGILNQITALFAQENVNIIGQHLQSKDHLSYMVMEVHATQNQMEKIHHSLKNIDGTLRTRLLF